jgi:hypothetical protein
MKITDLTLTMARRPIAPGQLVNVTGRLAGGSGSASAPYRLTQPCIARESSLRASFVYLCSCRF